MYLPGLFDSFFQGGFECSTHRRDDGRRLDLIAATGHDRWVAEDYKAMREQGLRTVRDGIRWHLVESGAGTWNWSSFLPMLRASREQDVQVIWDLCHYGWPDDIDIWRPEFVDRFARFAAAVARLVQEETDAVPFYSPINEISFFAWAGGDEAHFNPYGRGRGHELKHQLIRASIAAIEAIRAVEPRARFVQADPLIHVLASVPRDQDKAEAYRLAQYEAWDMLCGMQWPGLGGRPDYLDIIGVNYYPYNQWYLDGDTIPPGADAYRPLQGMLAETYRRYRRPLLIAETGAEDELRPDWLRYVANQVYMAMERGVPIEGICLYPVVDYPGWSNDRHCPAGLLGMPDERGQRRPYGPMVKELRTQQAEFGERVSIASQALPV